MGEFRDLAGDADVARGAAAQVDHEAGGEVEARQGEGRIDAALEAVARIGDEAEPPPGAGDVARIPEGRLDQHVGGALVAARRLPAHDAADRLDAVGIGDHHRVRVEPVGLAIEGHEALAVLRPTHDQGPGDLVRVEHVQRPAAVEGHVVGDVDERVDRAQADRPQALLHPRGRGTVLHAAHEAEGEERAETRVVRVELQRDGGRAGALAAHRRHRLALQGAEAGGGEIAGDAVDRGAVRAVRRQVDLDHRIVEPGPEGVGGADGCVGGQIEDAVVVLAEAQLRPGAEHAAALDPADRAHREGDVLARHVGARRREDREHAGPRVRRAAHDLERLPVPGIDLADPQAVGVGVLLGGDHPRDDVGTKRGGLVLDAFDFEADPRQRFRDRVEGCLGVEVVLEPGEGEFHLTTSSRPPERAGPGSKGGAVGLRRSSHPRGSARRSAGSRNAPASAHPPRRRGAGPACRI
ncbi:hypothetical protein CHKEEEPN_4405 [Methylorubrum podarium]|nr:hypothetical protein CHKEEEPN_4405 [Methylorubrum podarium]